MTFTAIHRALGLQPQPLTWEVITAAIEQGVTEQPDLDWKAVGYGAPTTAWDELAKDVAAMANSGGGLLVVGVREDHHSAAALRLQAPAALTDPEENAYRRVIFSRTHPPVQGVSFERIRGAGADEEIFAIHVPASPDAPHLIYKDRSRMLFASPFRDGTGTNWMAERQLEAAYRQRFAVRAEQQRDLRALYEDAAGTFDPAVRATIVAIARPEQPRPALAGRLTQHQVRGVFDAAHSLSQQFITGGGTVSAFTDVDLLNPRPGLRRYNARSVNEPEEVSRQAAVISLHDDGCITLIWSVGGFRSQSPSTVPSFMLERAAIDLAALVGATTRALNIDSGWSMQVGLTGSNIEILSQEWDRTWSVTSSIRNFLPVRLSIPPQADDDGLLACARDIALDCVNQAGVARLGVVRADS